MTDQFTATGGASTTECKVEPRRFDFKGRIPLLIGVTGHCDIRECDADVLSRSVNGLFSSLKLSYQNTPLVLLTSLAAGADQIVAECAVHAGIPIVVALPMPRDDYALRIFPRSGVAMFHKLLDKAMNDFVLSVDDDLSRTGAPDTGDDDLQFQRAGAYIARYSQLLVALWDGTTRENCRTCETVKFAHHGIPKPFGYGDEEAWDSNNRAVYRISTPRDSSHAAVSEVGEGSWLPSDIPGEQHDPSIGFRKVCEQIEDFNRSVAAPEIDHGTLDARLPLGAILSGSFLETAGQTVQSIHECFVRADLASKGAKANITLSFAMLMVAAAAASGILMYQSYDDVNPGLFMALASVLLTCAVLYRNFVRNKRHYQDSHQDYRSLAEGLRVQIFWYLAGIKESVVGFYLNRHKPELDWICYSIQVWDGLVGGPRRAASPRERDALKVMTEIHRHWIVGQAVYFDAAARINMQASRRWDDIATKCVGGYVILLFVGGFVLTVYKHMVYPATFTDWHNYSQSACGFVLGAAALSHFWSDKMAFAAHAREYAKMLRRFNRADLDARACLASGDVDKMRDLIFGLGKDCLVENAEWIMLHRDRELDVMINQL